jgi:hypothetical protein
MGEDKSSSDPASDHLDRKLTVMPTGTWDSRTIAVLGWARGSTYSLCDDNIAVAETRCCHPMLRSTLREAHSILLYGVFVLLGAVIRCSEQL